VTSVAIAAASIVTTPATLAAEALNIKTGLWEITSETVLHGTPPIPKELLDKMTAEQRTKMQAEIKSAASGAPRKDTNRECITQDDLKKPFESANAKTCTQRIVSTTRTSQEVHLVCKGAYQGTGVLKINTPTRDTMTGSLDMDVGDGKDAMNVKAQLTGKWLGEDCGEEAENEEDSQSGEPQDKPDR
jgi:hypothetical protein